MDADANSLLSDILPLERHPARSRPRGRAACGHVPRAAVRAGPVAEGGGDVPVRESTDGGRTWHAFAPLADRECGGIAFDRHTPGSVVFGCRDGLYASRDGGATIRRLEGGLRVPSGRSRTIALDCGRLFFLTSGSGVWRSDLPQE